MIIMDSNLRFALLKAVKAYRNRPPMKDYDKEITEDEILGMVRAIDTFNDMLIECYPNIYRIHEQSGDCYVSISDGKGNGFNYKEGFQYESFLDKDKRRK